MKNRLIQNYLERPILIHICKDRTLSYRTRNEPVFNKVALPIFSVNSKEEAEELFVLVGRRQYEEHPLIPGKNWYKITLDGNLDFKRYLDVENLEDVIAKLEKAYKIIMRSE